MNTLIIAFKGGPGSGHYDHPGRPGKVGGSQRSDYDFFDVEVSDSNLQYPQKVYQIFSSRQEVVSKFGKYESSYKKKLSDNERNAVVTYTEDAFINESLRNNKLDDKELELMKELDAAIDKGSMPFAASLYRYIIVDNADDLSKLQGKIISDSAYLSTSLEQGAYKELVAEAADSTPGYENIAVLVIRILVNKGAKVGLLGETTNFSTSEVLLPRNAKLAVHYVGDIKNENYIVGNYRTIGMTVSYVSE